MFLIFTERKAQRGPLAAYIRFQAIIPYLEWIVDVGISLNGNFLLAYQICNQFLRKYT